MGVVREKPEPTREEDISQLLPAEFDDEIVAATEEAAGSHPRGTDGMALASGMLAAGAATAKVVGAGTAQAHGLNVYLVRRDVEGGVQIVGRIGSRDFLFSMPFTEEEADAFEPSIRQATISAAAELSDPALAERFA